MGKLLSFGFLSVVVTFDCLHDNVWITCKSVLCVNFIFPLCQYDPGEIHGSLCSLPFPPFLPICCGFHSFVLRVKGTKRFAQISTPPLENEDAQSVRGACHEDARPQNPTPKPSRVAVGMLCAACAQLPGAMDNWDLIKRIKKRKKGELHGCHAFDHPYKYLCASFLFRGGRESGRGSLSCL